MSNENTNVNVIDNGENATVSTAPTPAKKIKKVKIKLPFTKTEQEDVLVGVNGKPFLLKRGLEVVVPASVAEVLELSEEMAIKSMEYEESLGDGN